MPTNRTIWLAVDKNGNEHIFSKKPKKRGDFWRIGDGGNKIHVPNGTIKKILRKSIRFEDQAAMYPGTKKCRGACGDTKPMSEFYHRKKVMAGGWIALIPHHICKKCASDYYYLKKEKK